MSLPTWFFNVRAGWKAIIAIAAIFGAGMSIGAAAGGLTKVPDRVVALELKADSLTDQLGQIQRDVAELRRSNATQLCLHIAERQATDWRTCLLTK